MVPPKNIKLCVYFLFLSGDVVANQSHAETVVITLRIVIRRVGRIANASDISVVQIDIHSLIGSG